MRPFAKWSGGKQAMVPEIIKRLPFGHGKQLKGVYHEPFLGGGAVLLSVLPFVRDIVISDANEALMTTWKAVHFEHEKLIRELDYLCNNFTREAFELARAEFNQLLPLLNPRSVEWRIAALFVYLNKTGFNGLYRVNQSGKFNVPWGKHANPQVYDALNLKAIHENLRAVEVTMSSKDFRETLTWPQKGDFVYIDSPFPPASGTSKFTEYTAGGFNDEDQMELAILVRQMSRRGALFVQSMPDQPFVRALYRGFQIDTVTGTRRGSALAKGRGTVSDLLISNL